MHRCSKTSGKERSSASSRKPVIDLEDAAMTVELQGYYILSRGECFSLSAGAGPMPAMIRRSRSSPNTSTIGRGSG